MDDLLALIEHDEQEKRNEPTVSFDEEDDLVMTKNKATTFKRPSLVNRNSATCRRSSSSNQETNKVRRYEAIVDTKTGINMINRNISSTELLEIISEHTFHSPSVLAQMSTFSRNELLVNPSPVIDESTVQGKTNLATVGVVFNNSGTRISSNGRAFAVLQIGTLSSGPCVTLFLFGDAYGKNVKQCQKGMVVCALGSNIVPPNNNKSQGKSNDCPIALSVRDARQLLVVARARDYGVCKATCWQMKNGVKCQRPCGNYVDKQKGQYCKRHQQQAKQQQQLKGQNRCDQLRRDSKQEQLERNLAINAARNAGQIRIKLPNGTTGIAHLSRQTSNNNKVQTQLLTDQGEAAVVGSNPFLNNVPRHMQKGGTHILHPHNVLNPYGKSSKAKTVTPPSTKKIKRQSTNNLTTLPLAKKQRTNNLIKDPSFDGRVYVPKPNNTLFGAGGGRTIQASGFNNQPQKSKEQLEQEIRCNQKLLAQRMCRAQPSNRQPMVTPSRSSSSSEQSLFGHLGNVNIEEIIHQKSQFEAEAASESYAKSRNALLQLERQEIQREKRHPQRGGKTARILVHYKCETCNKIFPGKNVPRMCRRMGHVLKQCREIDETKSVTEKRLELDRKSIRDGGMTLGRGIEWTRRSWET